MSFELNDEKAMDVLIWWIEGSDGSIDYREDEAVRRILNDLNYSLDTFYEKTLMYISGLSTGRMEELIDQSIEWGSKHFSEEQKRLTVALLVNIASSSGDIKDSEQEKLEKIKTAFGI